PRIPIAGPACQTPALTMPCVTQSHVARACTMSGRAPVHILTETVLSVTQAARRCGRFRGDRPTHPSTITRWILAGAKTPDGRQIRLEAVRLGGKWVTSEEALLRFAQAQTPELADGELAPPRPVSARQRASERADEILKD